MANRSIYPRVLFFIGGTNPTQEEFDKANSMGPGVVFRNAAMISTDGPIEDADAVAGVVPDRYSLALPNIDDKEGVQRRMDMRNPNNKVMLRADQTMTEEQARALAANDLARGSKRSRGDETALLPENRATQSGALHQDMTTEGNSEINERLFERDPISGRPIAPAKRGEPGQPGGARSGDGWTTGANRDGAAEANAGEPEKNPDGSVKLEGGTQSTGVVPGATASTQAPPQAKSDDAAIKAAALKARGGK